MTSHWITFILMILKNLKFHVQLKKFKFFKNRNSLNKVLIFSIKKKKNYNTLDNQFGTK